MKNPTDVFEFKLEEQPSEIEANRFCSKYTFTQNGIRGTNINSKETGDDPTVDMEAADGDFNGKSARSSLDAEDCSDGRMLRLGGIPTITSIKQRRYSDREPNNCIDGSFLEGSSYTGTAFQEIFYGSPSKDESVGTDSGVDESRSDESASYSSATPDNHDILDGPLSNHQFDQWGMFENKPIVFCPDYLYYRGSSYAVTDTTVTFSSNCVEVKGSTLNGNSETSCLRFGVEDIFQIQSHLSGRFDVAVFKIHVNKRSTTQGENAHESSGIEEVEFAVNDFDLSEKCEVIQSWDGYKAVWNYNEIEEWRENSHGETSDQQSMKYFPSYGEPLEEVYYPKGDPDAVCISKRDFDLLAPETFVNDTIIDFYIQYLKNGIPPEKRQRYHFFNCFFFRKLADMDKDPTSAFDGRAAFLRVRKWTRKVDLFDKEFVFIPVNYNYHWSLIVICHPGEVANFTDDDTAVSSVKVPCILHMDSFRGSHVGLKDLLQSYLWEEWKERTKETSEVVSSNFRNLRFLSLELPQQQNLSDCGLFLLHYVEHFLAEDPACISPYRIKNYHNEFLSVNWFQPHEPSIKRSAIQRLISNLLKNLSLENSPSCASGSCFRLKSSNYNENAVELVSGQFGSSKSSDNLPCSLNPFPTSSLGGVCASDSGLVLNESFEPESDEESLLGMRFGHSASFNEFRSSLSPIQEEVEASEHLVYASTETGLQHLGGSGSEPCALSYSSGSPTAEASWIPGVSVVEAVDEEDSSPTTSVHDSENPLEVEVVEPCRVDQNTNSDKINHPKSASVNNIDCLVDGEAASGELLDITLAQCSAETHDNRCLKQLQHDLAALEAAAADSSLWDNRAKAQETLQALTDCKDKLKLLYDFKTQADDAETIIKLTEEMDSTDSGLLQEAAGIIKELNKALDRYELTQLLSGPYDKEAAVVTITAGAGGTDAQDWADMLLRMYVRWGEKQRYKTKVVEKSMGEEAGIKSATIEIEGRYAYGYLSGEKGTHRIVRQSPFNSKGLRQTSFSGVEIMPLLPEDSLDVEIPEEDLDISFTRAGGKGGQNVNKVETAVRITHIPTGVAVRCTEERSQLANKIKALSRLKAKLLVIAEEQRASEIKQIRGDAVKAEWGQQIRNYVFHPYKLVKDVRTGYETSDITSVMDGDLDPFIKSYLKHKYSLAANTSVVN